jgi:KDO2-lipid IV(A) lauroyltransferase
LKDRARAANPHAPRRGLSARLLGSLHVTGVFWYRLHHWGARRLPEWLIHPAIFTFTLFFFLALRRIGRNLRQNLVPVLGPAGFLAGRRRAWRTLHEFAWCLTERYEHLSGRCPLEMTAESLEAWRSVAGGGTGFIVLTAHVGAWEAAASTMQREEGRRVHLVREEEADPEAQAFVRELLAARSGAEMVTHFAGDPLLATELAQALAGGEVVALQGDRPRAGGRTIGAELFGRPFLLPVGPLALARATGAPLLPVFAVREGRRRFRVAFREPIEVPSTEDRRADLEGAAGRVAAALEWAIRRAPHQWFCFGPAWGQPTGSKKRLSPAERSSSPSTEASTS